MPINHNSPEHREADEALEQLEGRLSGNNELFADADQRLAVVREVQGIRASLQRRFVRAQLIFGWVNGILAWLAKEVSSGAIPTLAGIELGI